MRAVMVAVPAPERRGGTNEIAVSFTAVRTNRSAGRALQRRSAAAMTMRLFVRRMNFAEGAIGLGVDELRWPYAVRPGDVLTVETEIVDLRPSRSKPNYGIIRLRNVTTNQRDEIVQTMVASAMVPRCP